MFKLIRNIIVFTIALFLGLVLVATPPSNAAGILPKPSPTDSRVITEPGTYDQAQVDANAAAYAEVFPYIDQLQDGLNRMADSHMEFVNSCVAQLYERDQKYADDMNARWYIMQDQRAEIFNLRAKVKRKEALIQELRARIRDLRDQ